MQLEKPLPLYFHRSLATRTALIMSSVEHYSLIERTLGVLLSPLEYPSFTAWQQSAHRELVALTDTDSLCIYAPVNGAERPWLAPHVSDAALAEYHERISIDPRWDIIETQFARHTQSNQQLVSHEGDFLDRRIRERSAFHHEFLAPHRLNDLTVANATFAGGMTARLHFGNHDWRGAKQAAMRQQLVRSVLPAFKNGLATWQQMSRQRSELGFLVDSLSDAVLLFDAEGRLVHSNRSAQVLFGNGPRMRVQDSQNLQHEARLVASRINRLMTKAFVGGPSIAPSMANRDVATSHGQYSVRGTLAPSWMFGRTHGVMITISPVAAVPRTDADIRAEFGLTARELEVATHVAAGLSNQSVAEKLGVSFFTARNHVERVLNKLGATNRAQVGAMLRGNFANATAA